MHCVHCGRLIFREPAASVTTRGQALHYGPKCAAKSGLLQPTDHRKTLITRVCHALRPPRRKRLPAPAEQADWINETESA